jgi:hypothetical protein
MVKVFMQLIPRHSVNTNPSAILPRSPMLCRGDLTLAIFYSFLNQLVLVMPP